MKKLFLMAAMSFMLGTSVSVFAQKASAPKFLSNIEGIKEYSLENGMKVLLIPDQSQELIALSRHFYFFRRIFGDGNITMKTCSHCYTLSSS